MTKNTGFSKVQDALLKIICIELMKLQLISAHLMILSFRWSKKLSSCTKNFVELEELKSDEIFVL